MVHLAQRWPLATFSTLSFAFTWALLPFAQRTIFASLLALLGPAAAAAVTAAMGGAQERRDLGARLLRWRLPWTVYAVALLLPLPISAARSVLEWAAGAEGPIRFQPVSGLGLVVFVLVAGEEIGWRGFALPRLLERTGPWAASVAVGLLWALWHLPLFFMPEMPQFGTPFVSFVPYLIALSILLTHLAQATNGSVLIATLFHGAVNTFGVVNVAAEASLRGWSNAVAYGTAAALVVFARRGRVRSQRARRP